MRSILLVAIAASCLMLSACTGTGSPSAPVGQAANCADMIAPGTPLSADIVEEKVVHRCDRRADFDGHKATVYIAVGKLMPTPADVDLDDPSNNFAPRIVVLIGRFDENVKPSDNHLGVDEDYVGRQLAGQISVVSGGHPANADVLRLEEKKTEITLACISVVVTGKAGTPTKIGICRSLGRGSSDDRVIKRAKAIAEHDLPAIIP